MQNLVHATGAARAAADSSQYLTFTLGAEEYGVEILRVQEIRGYSSATPIPGAPGHVKGVINLRGAVVPVLDLRIKFDLPDHACNQFTVIVLVSVGTKIFGLVVDSVSDVLDIDRKDIDARPEFGAGVDTSFITGLARTGDRLVVLLNIDAVIGADTPG